MLNISSDEQIKATVAREILTLYPSATAYGVESSDQGAGYRLVDVSFEDGTVITHDSDTFGQLAERLDDELRQLRWGAFGDRDRDPSFDVDITTGCIIR